MITVVQIKRKIGENSVVIVITSNIPRKEKNKKKIIQAWYLQCSQSSLQRYFRALQMKGYM